MHTDLNYIAEQVAHIRAHFNSAVTRPYKWRLKQLTQLRKMLVEQEPAFKQALAADLAKSEYEAWTTEIGFTISELDHTLKKLKKWMKPRKVSTPIIAQPASSYQLPEPLGTVLIIGAWNYPIQLILGPLISAIAAGNCAVLKPSELAPASANLLAKLVPKYLCNESFWILQGAVAETTELLKQEFDHIMYTGGEGVAKIVMRAAAQHLTPVTLELGGKSPCIVDKNCDLDVTVSRIIWNKWTNAGQTCVAPDYVLIEKSHSQDFLQVLQSRLVEFYGENIRQNKDYGRIINNRHLTRLIHYLEGQNVVIGGEFDTQQKYLAPTVILDPPLNSPLMLEEIFGPILPIVTVDNIEQSIAFINRRPKPLALYVYTKNKKFEQQVLNFTSSGNTCINDGMMFMTNPNLPFGGVGNSGMGSYHGKTGFNTFSHLKTVMKRSTLLDPSLRYPPFTKMKLNLIKKLL
ncbi:aldehyde dehydrogenase family protein [Paraglaciecola aquimarina]|uniref:Aldehyde dehydrogenase n=1 Tax=Paraglaciecola aquimarina TaxID=1235557 RepID=A0ABU3STU7_9ALTE|nr:aldehyde dehydrogenase family protein [Paraglaciecola aquimarina]MDU0353434.1 aldehyde dehydrogenase family protein [Paraglaciecola aquimarina]